MLIASLKKEELLKIFYIFSRKIGIFILFVFILFFDGTYFTTHILDSQTPINILAILSFLLMYYRAYPRTRKLMIYAVIVGLLGEYFFSVFLGMYTYRLENVPWYVPFGHAALYGRVFIFSKDSYIRKHHKAIEQFFAIIIIALATIYLLFFYDVFGFVMTAGVFLLLLKRPKDRLFFYSMYILVAILEIGGTAFGAWKWPDTAFNFFSFLPSNNPPSGISLFYFLLDVSCFLIYGLIHTSSRKRFKAIYKRNLISF